MKIVPVFLLFFCALALAKGNLTFESKDFRLGEINQGEIRHVILHGKNSGDALVRLETAMSQGTGGESYRFPKTISPGEAFTVEFDLNTEFMEGPIIHTVVLVDENGVAWSADLEGIVKPDLLFSEKILDAGYYSAGESREWIFYVWNSDGKTRPEIKLSAEAKDFSAKISPVSLRTDKLDDIREGGKVPGVKVVLRTTGISRESSLFGKMSLRRIVGFENLKNPKAKSEVLIVGYWK